MRSGLAVLDVLRSSDRAGPGAGRARRRAVARPDLGWGASDRAATPTRASRSDCWRRCGSPRTRQLPSSSTDSFPSRAAQAALARPAQRGCAASLLEERLGLELTRPELARVQEATAGNPFFALELGRELVRTARDQRRARRCGFPRACGSCSEVASAVCRRDARCPARRLRRSPGRPSSVVAAAHGDRERVLEALEAAAREGVVELDDSRVRFAHPLLASICYEQAPVWKRRAVHRALAEAVADIEERARHLALAVDGPDAAVASALDAAAEQAAARGATAARPSSSSLPPSSRSTDPALARQRRLRAANFHRLAGEASGPARCSSGSSTEVPSGVERADVLFALASTFRADVSDDDRALRRGAGRGGRRRRSLGADPGHAQHLSSACGRRSGGARRRSRGAREGRASRRSRPARRSDHAGGPCGDWAAEITPGLLERGARARGAPWARARVQREPRMSLGRQHDASRRDRPGSCDVSRGSRRRRRREATRGRGVWSSVPGQSSGIAGRWQQALDASPSRPTSSASRRSAP